MSNLQLISNYKDNAQYRSSFNQLAHEVFGIDFEKWYQLGLWNDRYICYSYLDGNRVVANVSVSKLDWILKGERKTALQIGTVMTHPDYRQKGLGSNLLKTVLEEYEKKVDIIYLFPNDDALDFYLKYGFQSLQEGRFTLDVQQGKSAGKNVRKLDLSNPADLKLFKKLSSERTLISNIFGVDHAEGILGWYCVGILADYIYYLEDKDIIVICREKQGVFQMFDVISRERVNLTDILPQVSGEEITKVVFHFTPDFGDTDLSQMSFEPNETVLVKPESLDLTWNFAHPLTAHA